jgi:hypothetical protein
MTARVSVAALFMLLTGVAAACSVERLPVPSDAPPSRIPSASSAAAPMTPLPIETPWATKVNISAQASTAEVLGEQAGSVLVANVHSVREDPNLGSGPGDFTGQPAVMHLTVVRPDGGRRDVATLLLPTGIADVALGPTGYLALSTDRWENSGGQAGFVHELAVVDLRDPLGPEVALYPASTAQFAWSPSGQLAFAPPRAERTRVVLDPATGDERIVETDLGCCSWIEWTADGSAWFGIDQCDGPCDGGPGLIDSTTGQFRRADVLPLPYPAVAGTNRHDLSRDGWVIVHVAEFDDMGKGPAAGQVVTAPSNADAGFDAPRATVWSDSRRDTDAWVWEGWDTDGQGLLVVRSVDGSSLELTRYDEPGQPQTLAQVHAGPVTVSAAGVEEVHDVGVNEVPDVVLRFLFDGPTLWYSGTSHRLIELGPNIHDSNVFERTIVVGWIGD